MPGIARVGTDTAGGVILNGGNSTVIVNGVPAAVLGSPISGHGDSPHNGARMVTGSGSVFVQGISVCRQGDVASCGHTATSSSNVSAG